MNSRKAIELFTKFLKDNNISDEYSANVLNHGSCDVHQRIKDGEYTKILAASFAWDKTPQGSVYWASKSAKWAALLIEERAKEGKNRIFDIEYTLPGVVESVDIDVHIHTGSTERYKGVDLFMLFLLEEGALDKFIANRQKQHNTEKAFSFGDSKATDYIMDSLHWGGTLEGVGYWSNLDEKWLKIVEDKEFALRTKQKDAVLANIKKLYKLDALSKFIKSFKKAGRLVTLKEFFFMHAEDSFYTFISSSFCWSHTDEKHEYWCEIANEISLKTLDDKNEPHIKDFLYFLYENKALRKYVKNTVKYGKTLKSVFNTYRPLWIGGGFCWDSSPQGLDYWVKLDTKQSRENLSLVKKPEDSQNVKDIKEFLYFLYKNDALYCFFKNVKKYGFGMEFVFEKEPHRWILGSGFAWRETKEGVEYWDSIDNKWREKVRNI